MADKEGCYHEGDEPLWNYLLTKTHQSLPEEGALKDSEPLTGSTMNSAMNLRDHAPPRAGFCGARQGERLR